MRCFGFAKLALFALWDSRFHCKSFASPPHMRRIYLTRFHQDLTCAFGPRLRLANCVKLVSADRNRTGLQITWNPQLYGRFQVLHTRNPQIRALQGFVRRVTVHSAALKLLFHRGVDCCAGEVLNINRFILQPIQPHLVGFQLLDFLL